jgi:hypothetical protein
MDASFAWFVVLSTALIIALQIAIERSGIQGYSYRFRPRGLQIWHLGILPGRVIAYESIVEARRASVAEALIGLRYGLLLKRGVRLQLDRGWWRVVIVTPRDPESFLRDLTSRIPPRITI